MNGQGKQRYLLLKCVELDKSEKPSRILRLSEVQSAVGRNPKLQWGINPRWPAAYSVYDAEGRPMPTVANQGFWFVDDETDPPHCYDCYEFYHGIAVHPKNSWRAMRAAVSFARELGAKVFRI